MGTELFRGFGIDIAAEVLSALGPGVPDITLISRSVGTVSATNLAAGPTINQTSHTCKGFLDQYDSRRYGKSVIQQGTRVIVILGDSLPAGVTPEPEDRILAEGSTFTLTGPVMRDPAAATYVCEVRV